MPIQVLMPALSPTMEKGNLAKWIKSEGDKIKAGDVIAEIETDKATMEVEAVDEGVIEELLVPEGTEEVKVNTPIARLSGEGESAPSPALERLMAAFSRVRDVRPAPGVDRVAAETGVPGAVQRPARSDALQNRDRDRD